MLASLRIRSSCVGEAWLRDRFAVLPTLEIVRRAPTADAARLKIVWASVGKVLILAEYGRKTG